MRSLWPRGCSQGSPCHSLHLANTAHIFSKSIGGNFVTVIVFWLGFSPRMWKFFSVLTFPSKHLVSMTTVGSLYSQIIRQKSRTVLAMGPVPNMITHAWLSLYYILADLRYLELQYNNLFFHIPEQVILSLIITNRNKCILWPATYIQKAGINIVRALLSWNLLQFHTRKVI